MQFGGLMLPLQLSVTDKFPVTTEGRIIVAILMTAGVGLFGTFTAFVASWFVIDNKQNIESEK